VFISPPVKKYYGFCFYTTFSLFSQVLVTISSKYQSQAAAVAIITLDMHPVTYKATRAMTSSNGALGVTRFAGSAVFSDHDKNGNKVFEDSRNNLECPVPVIVADHDLVFLGIHSNNPFELIVSGNDGCVLDMKERFAAFLLEQPETIIELALDEKRSLSEESPPLTVKNCADVVQYLVVLDDATNKDSFRSGAQRIPNDFSMFTNVTSFLCQDVDAVNLRKLIHSGFNGYLAIAPSCSRTDNNTLFAELSTLDASSGSNVTVAADAPNFYRLARFPCVGIPSDTDCAVDNVCRVQHQIPFALFHQAVPPSMVHALVAFGATLVISYLCKRKRMKSKGLVESPWKKVPGGRRFFGNLPRESSSFQETVDHWASLYGQDGIFEANLAGKKYFFLCNEEKASIIFSKRPFQVTKSKRLSNAMNSLQLCGLFTAEGEDWKRERRFVGPALNHKNVKNYLPSVKLVTSRLLEKWEHYSETGGRAIAINDDMYSVAMDIVSLVSFSQDLNSLHTSTNLIQTMVKYVEITWKRALSPIPYWDIPIIGQYLDGEIKKVNEHCLHAIAELEKSTKAVGGNESEKVKKSQSFLAKMLVLNKKAEAPLITERMIGNMLTLVIAGYETTAVTLCSSMYAIAEDQTGLQEELAQEAMLIESIEDADLETFVTGLPRLRSFMYEVLRLKGAIQSGSFLSTVPIEIDGTVLPAESRFVVLWKYISTLENSAAGKSAPRGPRDAPLSKFCGRRWLTGSPALPSAIKPTFKNGFRPFGEGARVCPGRELAETEILVILSSIFRKFEISLESGHPPLKLVTQLAQAPGCDIKLVFKPRMAL